MQTSPVWQVPRTCARQTKPKSINKCILIRSKLGILLNRQVSPADTDRLDRPHLVSWEDIPQGALDLVFQKLELECGIAGLLPIRTVSKAWKLAVEQYPAAVACVHPKEDLGCLCRLLPSMASLQVLARLEYANPLAGRRSRSDFPPASSLHLLTSFKIRHLVVIIVRPFLLTVGSRCNGVSHLTS